MAWEIVMVCLLGTRLVRSIPTTHQNSIICALSFSEYDFIVSWEYFQLFNMNSHNRHEMNWIIEKRPFEK